MQTEIYESFELWLDALLENNDMPENTAAFNFNLYEESAEDFVYAVQLIASDRFEPDDDGEWACYEVWSSEEDIFCVSTEDEDNKDCEAAQKLITEMVREYLKTGRYRNILTASQAIGIGFVDGEIDIILKT